MIEVRADDSSSTASRSENGEFTDTEGKLRIDYEAAKHLYPDRDLLVLVETAKGGITPSYSPGAEGTQECVLYVVKRSNPFIGFIDVDWKLFRT